VEFCLKKRLVYYFALNVLVFSVLIAATALVARPLQKALLVRMIDLRDYLIGEAEDFLGFRIEYRSMGPSIFGYFDLRYLRVYGDAGGVYTRERPLISLDRVRVSYSFFKMMRGDVGQAIRSVRLDRPVFTLGPGENRELRALLDRFGGGAPASHRAVVSAGANGDVAASAVADQSPDARLFSLFDNITHPLRFSIRRGACAVRAGDNALGFQGLNFDAWLSRERVTVRGKWSARLSLNLPAWNFNVGMAGRLLGSYEPQTRRGAVTLNIPASQGEGFTISAMNFRIALDETGFTVDKIADRIPYTLNLAYIFDSGRLSGSFRADNFSPRELLILSGERRRYNRYLAMSINGTVSFDTLGGEGVSYGMDLSGVFGPYEPLGRMRYRVHGQGNERGVSFRDVGLRFDNRGEAAYTGDINFSPLAPNGTLALRDFSITGDGAVTGEFALTSGGGTTSFFSEELVLGDVQLTALDGEFVSTPSGSGPAGSNDAFLTVSALRFRNTESWDDVRMGELQLRGGYSPAPRELQARLFLDSVSAGDILAMLRPFTMVPPFFSPGSGPMDRLLLSTEIFVTTDFEHISYSAPQLVAAFGERQEVLVLASIFGTDRRFELTQGTVAWGSGGLDLMGMVDIANPDDIYFSLQTIYQDLVYYAQGTILDRRAFTLAGSYGLQGSLIVGQGGALSGTIEAGPVPIPVAGTFAQLSLGLSLRYEGAELWNALLDHLEIIGLPTPGSRNTLVRVSGAADQNGGVLQELFIDDGRNPLAGQAALFWETAGAISGAGRLESRNGREYYNIEGAYRNRSLEIDLHGEHMQLSRFIATGLNPVAAGSARFSRDETNRWVLEMNLDSLSARQGEASLEASGRGRLDSDALVLEDITIRYGGLTGEIRRVEFNREDARLDTGGRIGGTALGKNLDLLFSAHLDVAPLDSWLDLGAAAESLTVSFEVPSITFGDIAAAEPFRFVFTRSEGALALSGGPGNMLRLNLDDEGAFYTSLIYPSPVRGVFTGFISSGTIDIGSSNLYVDLGKLFQFLPNDNKVNCTGGLVAGRVRVQGPLGDPEFYGALYGTGVILTVSEFLGAEIGPTPITVSLEGNEMTFGPQYAQVGNGSAVVNAWFRFERWIPDTFTIDIRANPETPVPFAFNIDGVISHGDASGTIAVSMENRELRVLGNLTGDDAEIILDLDEMAAAEARGPEGPDDGIPVYADISVKSGRKVDFYWPNARMPILRGNAAVGAELRIISDSLAGRVNLDGDVILKSGEISYVQRSFYIRDGILAFNRDDLTIDPRITARAETRERSEDGPVTISMIVDHEPLRSFTARFESNPPLSQAEIFSLLGQGFSNPSGEAEPDAVQNTILASMDILTQFVVTRRVERLVRDFLGLDMFSFRTSLIRNVVSQAWNPVDRNGSVGNYFDNTTVYVGKYVGTNMFVQGMVSLRYDDLVSTRTGVSRTNVPRSGRVLSIGQYTLEPDIGIELSSPLFDIRWNITPLHFENMFVDDMSFTLTWRWTIR
jgi:hypothetical protein